MTYCLLFWMFRFSQNPQRPDSAKLGRAKPEVRHMQILQSVARLEIASAARRGEAHVPATLAAPTAEWLQGKLRKLVT